MAAAGDGCAPSECYFIPLQTVPLYPSQRSWSLACLFPFESWVGRTPLLLRLGWRDDPEVLLNPSDIFRTYSIFKNSISNCLHWVTITHIYYSTQMESLVLFHSNKN